MQSWVRVSSIFTVLWTHYCFICFWKAFILFASVDVWLQRVYTPLESFLYVNISSGCVQMNEWMYGKAGTLRPLSIAHILTLIRKTTNWGEYVQHIWCGFSVFKFWRKRAGKCGPYYVVDFTFNSYHLALEYKYRALRCGFKTILSLSIDIWHFHWIRVEINRFLNHHPYLIIAVFSIDSDYISCDHIEPTISHSVISSRGISKVWITANIQIFHPKTCDE